MWNGTSRNRLLPSQSCLATTGASFFTPRASGLPWSSRCSTAMKCDLPEPKLPCRYEARLGRPSAGPVVGSVDGHAEVRERLVERLAELIRDDVLPERRLGLVDPFGQVQDE